MGRPAETAGIHSNQSYFAGAIIIKMRAGTRKWGKWFSEGRKFVLWRNFME